jgi:hypothetical protein
MITGFGTRPMNQRFLMWGLVSITFVVTLAVSSWHEGLWPSHETPTHGNRPTTVASADPVQLPSRPFGPQTPPRPITTPATAVVTPPPPAPAPQQQDQPLAETPPPALPTAEAEVDTAEFLAHRDRASQHSARTR